MLATQVKNLKADLRLLPTKKALTLMMFAISTITAFMFLPKTVHADSTAIVRGISDISQIGPGDAIGQEFNVAMVIENITTPALYGFGIKMYVDTTYFEYVSHTTTVPWNGTYETPIPPSPYGGILYSPYMPVKDEYDPATSILEVAYSSQAPAPAFTGNGTVCIVTLRVKYQHFGVDDYVDVTAIEFKEIKLAGYSLPPPPPPIPYNSEDFTITVYGRPQPPGPKVEVEHYTHKGSDLPHELDLNVSILNLDKYWDLTGFDLKISFDPNTVQVESVTLGDFAEYYNMTYHIQTPQEINNETGLVWVAYMFDPTKVRTIPEGNGTLITLRIIANCSSPIEIVESKLASFPHPERSEEPWNNQPYSIAIPHDVTDGKAEIIGIKSFEVHDGISVITESNYCVTFKEFDTSVRMLLFEVYVSPEEEGYVNITIPLVLMYSPDTYRVFINGRETEISVTQDDTNAYVYVTYDDSAVSIMLLSHDVIPEFPTSIMLLTIFSIATFLTAALKFKRKN